MATDESTWTPESGKPQISHLVPRKANIGSALYAPPPSGRELYVARPLFPPARAPEDHQARGLAPLWYQWRVDRRPHVPHVDHDDDGPAGPGSQTQHPALHKDGLGA